jgi:hypothetical protein
VSGGRLVNHPQQFTEMAFIATNMIGRSGCATATAIRRAHPCTGYALDEFIEAMGVLVTAGVINPPLHDESKLVGKIYFPGPNFPDPEAWGYES